MCLGGTNIEHLMILPMNIAMLKSTTLTYSEQDEVKITLGDFGVCLHTPTYREPTLGDLVNNFWYKPCLIIL